jgi:hypothetical protein
MLENDATPSTPVAQVLGGRQAPDELQALRGLRAQG